MYLFSIQVNYSNSFFESFKIQESMSIWNRQSSIKEPETQNKKYLKNHSFLQNLQLQNFSVFYQLKSAKAFIPRVHLDFHMAIRYSSKRCRSTDHENWICLKSINVKELSLGYVSRERLLYFHRTAVRSYNSLTKFRSKHIWSVLPSVYKRENSQT